MNTASIPDNVRVILKSIASKNGLVNSQELESVYCAANDLIEQGTTNGKLYYSWKGILNDKPVALVSSKTNGFYVQLTRSGTKLLMTVGKKLAVEFDQPGASTTATITF